MTVKIVTLGELSALLAELKLTELKLAEAESECQNEEYWRQRMSELTDAPLFVDLKS